MRFFRWLFRKRPEDVTVFTPIYYDDDANDNWTGARLDCVEEQPAFSSTLERRADGVVQEG